MATTHIRRRFVLTAASAAAVALAVSLAACTTVTRGTAVMGDPGPCTHVDAPMLDVPTTSSTEPQMRIPQPPGWERSTELEDPDEGIRFTLANSDLVANEPPQNVVDVVVESVPDADAQTIFDEFQASLVQILDEEGLPADLTRTAGTLCGLPSETVTLAGADMRMGAAVNALPGDPATALLVVTESGGDTYLIAVVQTIEPDNPTYQRDAETILTGFEVLPLAATTA
jgi:hypothetical protein